ncbi:MAG TPA: hypothetical protein VJQ54_23425 [Candidatus Sulfotelmatobacter sp.]|nr:hypothetical protein [Candidatus Sulfotelmatobacter sp.]
MIIRTSCQQDAACSKRGNCSKGRWQIVDAGDREDPGSLDQRSQP